MRPASPQALSVRSAIKERRRHNSNIWVFHSPKNNRRLIIRGDLAFMHLVIAEGTAEITAYEHEAPTVFGHGDGEERKTTYDARVQFADEHVERWEFKWYRDAGPDREGRARGQLEAQAQAAQAAGETYRVITERDLKAREVYFDNWLFLCAAMNRCRREPLISEMRDVERQLYMHRELSLQQLLDMGDPALTMAALARGLQKGVLVADLEKQLLCRATMIRRREK